jgi:hypothetical protein
MWPDTLLCENEAGEGTRTPGQLFTNFLAGFYSPFVGFSVCFIS